MAKNTKLFTAALAAVRSPLWVNEGQQRKPLLKQALRNMQNVTGFSSGATVINGLNKNPETVKISVTISVSPNDRSYVNIQYIFENDAQKVRVDKRYFDAKLKATFSPTEHIDVKTANALVLISDVFAHAATFAIQCSNGPMLSQPVAWNGSGAGVGQHTIQHAHASASAPLLPPLTKWKKEKFSFGVRYTYGSGDGFFKIDQNPRNKKWVVNGSNIHELFPKLAKAFPYHEVVLRDGVLVNDRGDADEFSTPAAARTALLKALKLTLIRNTNAEARSRNGRVAVAASYPTLKPLAKWSKEEDEDNVDGGFYYTVESPGDGSFIIALDDTGWVVIHEYKTQQALARDPDGKFYASKNCDDNVKEIHFQTAQEAWYALSAIWKKLDVKNMEKFSDALPTIKSRAITAASVTSGVAVAGDTLSDRVASIVYGDLKRIKSTIAAWKGKMTPDQYKEFVDYQSGVAKFIAQTFVPKLSEAYKAKVNGI